MQRFFKVRVEKFLIALKVYAIILKILCLLKLGSSYLCIFFFNFQDHLIFLKFRLSSLILDNIDLKKHVTGGSNGYIFVANTRQLYGTERSKIFLHFLLL